ncbi:SPOR domain-containing protein [Elizabethkingia sp. HX XZB]|uniref:SPOR domain-containing protein n=1 Tax=Elizabethkingia sp. HX XZB TaxID=3003193 RepID=UPI002A23AE2D|nr:SPOR domain-containing protein [Elizabethkingia sp. HX XZB]MDX8569349.1 SPOR domain-containing protein [Elizabethkingia sp. HX XZB]
MGDIKIYILLIGFSIQYVRAQEITNIKDSINGNVYSMEMDVRIDNLLKKMENNCIKSNIDSKIITKKKVANKFIGKKETKKDISFSILSIADICRRQPKLMGYKIQIIVVNNSNEANKMRSEIRNNFPSLRVELDSSFRPNYRVLAGSFFSKQSGTIDLKNVRKIYHDAILIPYRIFCVESK